MSMKIALCLSGQPRGLPVSLEYLKKGLDIQNMDVFFHAWFDPSAVGTLYDSAQESQTGKVGKVHPDTEKILLETLTPVDYVLEPQRSFPFTQRFRNIVNVNQDKLTSSFYSIYIANLLKRKHELLNDFKYDLVIRARYDLVYEEKIDVTKYMEIAKTHIVTSEKFQGLRNDPNFVHGNYTLTDIFAFSSSENMDVFCDTYPNMTYIHNNIRTPYGENYLGYRVRVMGGLEAHCVPEFKYEILHRVIDTKFI